MEPKVPTYDEIFSALRNYCREESMDGIALYDWLKQQGIETKIAPLDEVLNCFKTQCQDDDFSPVELQEWLKEQGIDLAL
ncbi:MAG: hypothetical protein J7525_19850 [Roseofilum sp. SID3]|uniref:hypothetical protein n=1 Tax=Roseofilum sp. SID3 TaxID=2821499 RepID=UPI001B18E91E|nr:hypothetical protein [Roseofilum sp. SID3]MBP0015351.1 hypothetical protein [Roseofilum sp. SID3]